MKKVTLIKTVILILFFSFALTMGTEKIHAWPWGDGSCVYFVCSYMGGPMICKQCQTGGGWGPIQKVF